MSETFAVRDLREPPLTLDRATPEQMWAEILFRRGVMPCCGLPILYQEGPEGGLCQNIRCAHCKAEWNINPPHFIQRIGVTEVKPKEPGVSNQISGGGTS